MVNRASKIEDYGIRIGDGITGVLNNIADVPGVKVGHVTLDDGPCKTGVTAVLPHSRNLFQEKVMAASHVINGFGKSVGLIQINELGTIETPIILTNTLSIGMGVDGLTEYMLDHNPEIGRSTGTVNPIVCECNDMLINDIRGRFVKQEHVKKAIQSADTNFEEGAVGAGKGMVCYGLKGGIGSASRMFKVGEEAYTLGILVLANFGKLDDLKIDGKNYGKSISSQIEKNNIEDKGSIIIILATDVPLTERQLTRVIKRTTVGIANTGSYISNGSGDIAIGFTTANRVSHNKEKSKISLEMIHENDMDTCFRAAKEATEEAILNALINAERTIGRNGEIYYSLKEFLEVNGKG